MTSPALEETLHDLRAAALRAIARKEFLPAEKWRVEESLSGQNFGASIDRFRESRPWYVAGYHALRYRFTSRFS